jgi:hypothetical protein
MTHENQCSERKRCCCTMNHALLISDGEEYVLAFMHTSLPLIRVERYDTFSTHFFISDFIHRPLRFLKCLKKSRFEEYIFLLHQVQWDTSILLHPVDRVIPDLWISLLSSFFLYSSFPTKGYTFGLHRLHCYSLNIFGDGIISLTSEITLSTGSNPVRTLRNVLIFTEF